MKVLAVDPGTLGNMGWSRFWEGVLLDAGEGKPESIVSHIISAEVIAFEMPEIYRARHSKGDPNRLKGLIKQIGWIQGVAWAYNHECAFVEYQPKQWKGNIPKPVHHERAHSILTSVDAIPPPFNQDNAWDAIALGLYVVGRYTPNAVAAALRSKGR